MAKRDWYYYANKVNKINRVCCDNWSCGGCPVGSANTRSHPNLCGANNTATDAGHYISSGDQTLNTRVRNFKERLSILKSSLKGYCDYANDDCSQCKLKHNSNNIDCCSPVKELIAHMEERIEKNRFIGGTR